MSRKQIKTIFFVVLLIVCGAVGGLFWILQQTPDFYEQVNVEQIPKTVRQKEAKRFTQETLQLVDDIKHKKEWAREFTQRQMNCWFAEELTGQYKELLPPDITAPRLQLANKTVQLGFQYNYKGWSGIVSIHLKPWIPAPHQLALEILSIKAGSLPIPLDKVFEQLGSQLKERGWHVTWKQSNGNDVMIINFDQHEKKQSVLESLEIIDKKIRITGKGKGKE